MKNYTLRSVKLIEAEEVKKGIVSQINALIKGDHSTVLRFYNDHVREKDGEKQFNINVCELTKDSLYHFFQSHEFENEINLEAFQATVSNTDQIKIDSLELEVEELRKQNAEQRQLNDDLIARVAEQKGRIEELEQALDVQMNSPLLEELPEGIHQAISMFTECWKGLDYESIRPNRVELDAYAKSLGVTEQSAKDALAKLSRPDDEKRIGPPLKHQTIPWVLKKYRT